MEAAIRKLVKQKDEVKARSITLKVPTRDSTFQILRVKYPELEDKLYEWIENGRRRKLELPPSIVLHNARHIADPMNIS
jgi:hypothetical protein